MTPLVSICVPNLNARPFLEERFQAILGQTLQDWELFVYDSHSDDGSWELIQDFAKKDSRIRILQGPREGPYPAWNECLRNTSGEYVYVATSDDSMAPEFLERMVAGLEANPDCDLAHSPVVIVDDRGAAVKDLPWPDVTAFADGIGDLVSVPHIRRAPYDGLVQLTGRHVVLSITQLLIRRSLFSRIGTFTNRWGSVSDFNWEMRAGLLANTIHVPNTWATWRYHPGQLTARVDSRSPDYFRNIEEMIQDAVRTCEPHLPAAVLNGLRSGMLERAKELRTYYSILRDRRDRAFAKRFFQASQMFAGSKPVRSEIRSRILGRPKWADNATTEIRQWLESLGLQPLAPCAPASPAMGGRETSAMSAGRLSPGTSL
jgi:glycosyltransferase involved in cell wall biosynthesis